MADDIGSVVSHQNPNTVWKRKFLTLQRRCEQIEQENERVLNRLYHVNKLLRRYRRQRRLVRDRLDEYKDDYRNAQPPLQSQLMAEIVPESLPTFLSFSGSMPLSPGQTSNATTSSQKKSKSRTTSKQDKERDPNAPKKPANAFFMFCQQQRNVMHEDQRDAAMGHHELTKTLAKEWNNLIEDEKKVYYEMYERDKERYEQEMKKYTSDRGNSSKKDKDSSKKSKSKSQKTKASSLEKTGVPSTSGVGNSRSSVTVSPTLNPLSPQSLISVPFNLPMIPSPTLPPTDKDDFQDFNHLSSLPPDSYMET